MAEKNVSGPPVLAARPTKPVSEALLNEKVRTWRFWEYMSDPAGLQQCPVLFPSFELASTLVPRHFEASRASVAYVGMWQLAMKGEAREARRTRQRVLGLYQPYEKRHGRRGRLSISTCVLKRGLHWRIYPGFLQKLQIHR